MEYQFSGVFVFKKRVYVTYEERVGGPRVMLSAKEMPPPLSAAALGAEVEKALGEFQDKGRVIYADEWETLNQRLLKSFGEKSVSAFERKKKEVTVRRATDTGRVALIGPKDKEIELDHPTVEELGQAIMGLLGLQ